MKTSYITAIALAVSTLVAGPAFAADNSTGKTRAQVQAELVQARATGDIIAPDQLSIDYTGRTGAKLNEVFPAKYAIVATVAPASTKTRAEVMADLSESKRTGNITAPTLASMDYAGYGNAKLNEIFPSRYPAVAAAPSKTRAEVRTELAEAQRTGDIQADNLESLVYAGIPGLKLKDVHPTQYPTKTRASVATQVVALAN